VLGVLQLDTPSLAGVFRERDLDLLTAIADLAAGAVARIRLARLGRYHSPSVVAEVLRQRDAGGRGLREADVTVLFADLVGFTAFAESTAPDEVVELLRGFFDRAVEAVFSQGGTLDKFLGDGVLAFFGAPVAQPDHPERAVAAATRLRQALASWNEERREASLPSLDVRMALESGSVLVGEIGSEPRMEYTVLGSTVNRAARLEQTVAGAGEIVLGPEIHERLDPELITEDLGELRLRGLEGTVRVYRLPSPEPTEPTEPTEPD
jgi:class 3 adenylate cyclase